MGSVTPNRAASPTGLNSRGTFSARLFQTNEGYDGLPISTQQINRIKKGAKRPFILRLTSLSAWTGKTYGAGSYRRLQGRKGLLFDLYSDIFLPPSALFERNAGHATTITRKLCLHGRTQRRQTSLYLRLPSESRKNAHSSFHFWLLLIGHAPVSAPCGAWAYLHVARTSQP